MQLTGSPKLYICVLLVAVSFTLEIVYAQGQVDASSTQSVSEALGHQGSSSNSSGDVDYTIPPIATFASGGGIGATASSLQLATGDINLPISLINIPGKRGLDVSVNIEYSSNVHGTVDTWNVEAPTGVLGLGWNFGFSAITRDHKGTGTRHDDVFYHEGVELIRNGSEGTALRYETKAYNNWKILYFPSIEKWEVTKGDGSIVEYGEETGRNTLQYGVKWGNWIGESSETAGQQQFVAAWNQSRSVNLWGDEVTYEYEALEEPVGYNFGAANTYIRLGEEDDFSIFNTQQVGISGTLNNDESIIVRKNSSSGPVVHTVYSDQNDYPVNSAFTGYANKDYFVSIVSGPPTKMRKIKKISALSDADFTYTTNVSGTTNHTVASYLKKIVDSNGRSVEFTYAEKLSEEYQDPHAEQPEPDAYQERYETRYLDQIEVLSPEASTLFTIEFDYNFMGQGDLTKRLLSSITHQNPDGMSLPGLNFTYLTAHPNYGALEQIFLPSGGDVLYTYEETTLEKSDRELILEKPDEENPYDNYPELFYGSDYLVVAWRNTADNSAVIESYVWTGHWRKNTWDHSSGNTSFPNFFENTSILRGTVVTSNNFFGIIEDYFTDAQTKSVHLVHRAFNSHTWRAKAIRNCTLGVQGGGDWQNNVNVVAGSNVLSLVGREQGYGFEIKWDGDSWNKSDFLPIGPLVTSNDDDFFNTGILNWMITHRDENGNPGNDMAVRMHYLDEENTRHSVDLPNLPNHTQNNNDWYAGKTFAIGVTQNNTDYIYQWDEDFTQAGFTTNSVIGSVPYASLVSTIESMISIYGIVDAQGLRWTGQDWIKESFSTSYRNSTNSKDLILRHRSGISTNDGSITAHYFNPNSLQWEDIADFNNLHGVQVNASPNKYSILAGSDNIRKVYARTHLGWNNGNDIPMQSEDIGLYVGNNFYVYADVDPVSNISTGAKVSFFKNGQWQPEITVGQEGTTLVRGNILVHRRVNATSENYVLYHLVNGAAEGDQIDYPVTAITVNDGFASTSTYYDYNEAHATIDRSSSIAQYNEVTILPANQSGSFGKTVYYFHSNLANSEVAKPYIGGNTSINSVGRPYIVERHKEGETSPIAITTYKYLLTYNNVGGKGQSGHFHPTRITEEEDGVESVIIFEYNIRNQLERRTVSNFNSQGVEDTYEDVFIYSWSGYTDLETANIIDPVITNRTKVNGTLTSSTATTWQVQSNGVWSPHKNYSWDATPNTSAIFDFDLWSNAGEPGSEWLKLSEVESINSAGFVVETSSIKNGLGKIYSNTKYSDRFPVASFSNARASETSYNGFESGVSEDGWTDEYGDISDISHTGSHSWQIQGHLNDYYIARTFLVADLDDLNGKYAFGAWVKSTSSETNIDLKYNYNGGQHSHNVYHSGSGEWEYLYTLCDLTEYSEALISITALVRNTTDQVDAYFDDLWVGPIDASFGAVVFDRQYDIPIATIGQHGNKSKLVYDKLHRLIGGVGSDNVPNGSQLSSGSLERNATFQTSDPNLLLKTSVRGTEGTYIDFTNALLDWSIIENANSAASTWQVVDQELHHSNDGGGVIGTPDLLIKELHSALTGRVGIELTLTLPDATSGQNFGIALGGTDWDYTQSGAGNAVWSVFNSSDWVTIDNSSPNTVHDEFTLGYSYRLQVIVDLDNQLSDFYVNGVPCLQDVALPATANEIKKLVLFNEGSGAATDWKIDDLFVYTNPSHSIVYSDGLSKARQVQYEVETGIYLAETLYDELNRPFVQTKIAESVGAWFGYRSGFVIDPFDAVGGLMNGEVNTAYPDDQNRPYYRTVYEASPFSPAIEQGMPGATFALGGGHTASIEFGANEQDGFLDNLPDNEYFKTVVTDPQGIQTTYVEDKVGQVIGVKTSSTETTYEYDDKGNAIRIYPPNYYQPPGGAIADDYIVDLTYDHRGLLTSSSSSDDGVTDYIYDQLGQVRFSRHAEGALPDPDLISYWKYDDFGRVVEEGYLEDDEIIWGTSLQNKADTDPTYPPTPIKWRMKYFYDGDGSDPTLLNRLEYTQSNNDIDIAAEIEERYAYNADGEVLNKSLEVLDFEATSYATNYTYDNAGFITQINFYSDNLNVDNQTLSGTATHEAGDSLNSTNTTVASGSDITFTAGQGVVLRDGFIAENGATFVASATGGNASGIVTYSYNRLGQPVSVGIPGDDDFYASYSYNALGQMTSESIHPENGSTVTTSYDYNPVGWMTDMHTPGYFREQLDFTSNGYLGTGYYNGDIARLSYSYLWSNSLGNIPPPTNYDVEFQYDDLQRLQVANFVEAQAKFGPQTPLDDYDIGIGAGNEISYDHNGNILSLKRGSVFRNYTYEDGTNRVINTNGTAALDYQYDANGNMNASTPKNISSIYYDPHLQLTRSINMTGSNAGVLDFQYSDAGERLLKSFLPSGSSTTASTMYQPGLSGNILVERDKDGTVAGEARTYIYGPTGLLAFSEDGETFFPLKDHLGSNRVLVNENGLVVGSYDYAAFGEVMRSTETQPLSYQFTGQELDSESDLYNYRARLYDAELGRFYAMDPALEYSSPYSYVGSNPTNRTDPSGMMSQNWGDIYFPYSPFGDYSYGGYYHGYGAHTLSSGESTASESSSSNDWGFECGTDFGCRGWGYPKLPIGRWIDDNATSIWRTAIGNAPDIGRIRPAVSAIVSSIDVASVWESGPTTFTTGSNWWSAGTGAVAPITEAVTSTGLWRMATLPFNAEGLAARLEDASEWVIFNTPVGMFWSVWTPEGRNWHKRYAMNLGYAALDGFATTLEGMPEWGEKEWFYAGGYLTTSIAVTIFTRGKGLRFGPKNQKLPGRFADGTFSKVNFKELRKMVEEWDKGTFESPVRSLRYHINKHAKDKSNPLQYMNQAREFFNSNRKAEKVVRSDGTDRWKTGKGQFIIKKGGKSEGKIVSFGWNYDLFYED
ncbi:MAG: RHS repeat-associated core domain-containing protein [Calditrichia bacterium]